MVEQAIDKSGERVRTMFGQIAPRYDLLNHLLSLNIDRSWRARAVRILRPVPGEPILDVCTGTGDLAFAIHRATGGKSQISAVDFCPEMLEIGQKKKTKRKIGDELVFLQADAQALPFPDDAFAMVAVAFGLRNVSDTDQGLREMARVCRPGGKVGVLEFSMPTWQPLAGLYRLYFRRVLPRIGQLLARNSSRAYEYLPATVSEFPSGEALLERMRAAGLQNCRCTPFTFGVASLYVGTK